MAIVSMTDLDWLAAYSTITGAALQSLDPDTGSITAGPITIPVTFDASETFSDFAITLPFDLPWGSIVQFCDWGDDGFLDMTRIALTSPANPKPTILEIWGSNNTASERTVPFHFFVQVNAKVSSA